MAMVTQDQEHTSQLSLMYSSLFATNLINETDKTWQLFLLNLDIIQLDK